MKAPRYEEKVEVIMAKAKDFYQRLEETQRDIEKWPGWLQRAVRLEGRTEKSAAQRTQSSETRRNTQTVKRKEK